MSILNMWGWEWGQDGQTGVDREGLVAVNNNFIYDDAQTPPTGGSTFSIRSSFNGPSDGVVDIENSPSGSGFWIHFQWYRNANQSTSNNNAVWISWNEGLTKIGEVRLGENCELEVVINGGSTFTATYPIGLDRWKRIHVFVDLQNTATGTIRVYEDGDLSNPVIDQTSVNTNPSSRTFDTIGIGLQNNDTYLDDLLLMDPNDATGITDPEEIAFVTIPPKQPNSDGNYTAWTATGSPGGVNDYEYIDEVPPGDGDYIQATATGQASTFGYESATSSKVLACKWKGRFLRSGTDAGANMNVRRRDVSAATDYDTADISVPGDGYIREVFPEKPGGGTWTEADFNDTEWGVVSKT